MARTFRVIALVAAYNEEDVIGPMIAHLVRNDVEVYLLDNGSTDGTVREASRFLGKGLLAIEPFPDVASAARFPTSRERFSLGEILAREEELASELDADWFMHHDADEFRESPWPGFSLREAIEEVDRLGYSCIDFRVFNFPPTDDGYRPGTDPRDHLLGWEPPAAPDRIQRKGWKRQPSRVSLAPSGGHDVAFDRRLVFPIRFLLRHYPIRSQAHGLRKVLAERRPRYSPAELERGWHIQYDTVVGANHDFLRDPSTLRPFDLAVARLESLLEPRGEAEAVAREAELRRCVAELESSLASAAAARRALVTRCGAAERECRVVSGERNRLERRARELGEEAVTLVEALRAVEGRAATSEARAGHLETETTTLAGRLAELGSRLTDTIRSLHIADDNGLALARELADARHSLELARSELAAMRASWSWRLTAPGRAAAAPVLGRTRQP